VFYRPFRNPASGANDFQSQMQSLFFGAIECKDLEARPAGALRSNGTSVNPQEWPAKGANLTGKSVGDWSKRNSGTSFDAKISMVDCNGYGRAVTGSLSCRGLGSGCWGFSTSGGRVGKLGKAPPLGCF